MTVRAANFDLLPADADVGEVPPGEYQCPDCGARVTVNAAGTEFGHRRAYSDGFTDEDCSRRDPALNPTKHNGGEPA